MRVFLLVLVALVMANCAFAQRELPDSPKPKVSRTYGSTERMDRRIFLAGTALLGTSKAADAWQTRSLLDRGGWENNPIFGRYPLAGRQTAINSLFFAGQVGVFYATEHNRRAWVRWAGRAYIGLVIVNHAKLAACNAGIDVHSPTVHNCRPILPLL